MENEYLSEHTSFRVGGPTGHYYIPESREELISILEELRARGEDYKIIGNGSNLLVSDRGVDFSVIELKKCLDRVEAFDDTGLYAEAGAQLSRVAGIALKKGLTGMEGLHGIPGTVGGAVVMNAGAFGTELKDVLESCEVLTADGECKSLSASELELSYRHSCIEEKGYTVLSVRLRLREGNTSEISEKMQEYLRHRLLKQPLDMPSAGSTFKRPEGRFAGQLIDEAGLRGFRIGDAQISEKHCGFVVNRGAASASELRALINEVISRVEKSSGVELEPEVKLWGSFL